MPKVVDHNQRRQEILDIALELFAEQGFYNVNLVSISQRCGISRPTLYLYFKDKDEMFTLALKNITDLMLEEYLKVSKVKQNYLDMLIEICTSIIKTAFEHKVFLTNLADVMFQLRKEGQDFTRGIRKRTIRLNHLFYKLFSKGIQKNEIKDILIPETISYLFSMMETFAFQMAIIPNYDPKPSIDVISLYLSSLRKVS